MTAKLVAVTGASGFIGRYVVAELHKHNLAVRALQHTTRVAGTVRSQSVSTEIVTGALHDPAVLVDLLDGAEAVIHCAFAHVPGRYRGGEGDNPLQFWQTNFGGTLALLDACVAQGIQTCTLLSSRAVFGSQNGTVDDQSATAPDTHYGALKVAEESLEAAYRNQRQLRIRCVRATGVFGQSVQPEQNKWWPLVQQTLAAGSHQLPAFTERTFTEVYAGDLANALYLSLDIDGQQRTPPAKRSNLNCSDLLLTQSQVINRIRTLAGWSELQIEAPQVPLQGPHMHCSGLASLNWQPQGWAAVDKTLIELIAHYRLQHNSL